jgi:GntR family transcriptional repressor for pyruvate dehydrogenase complex
MGVVESRHGSGTYITANRSLLSTTQLMLLSKLHGFSDAQLFEVRRILEVDIAGLAAERATAEDLAAISEEVMEMYVNLAEPQKALIHDIRFHRALARASANPVLGALLDMVAELFYEQRKETVEHWMGGEGAVEHHRQIYQAIRDGDRSRARTEMDTHLRWAQKAQELEEFERGNR